MRVLGKIGLILTCGLIFGYTVSELESADFADDNPDKEKFLIEILNFVLDRGHYDPTELTDEISYEIYNNYLEAIDGQHRFFLKSDIDEFENYQYRIDDEVKQRSLKFFSLTHTRLVKRMESVKTFYAELLETPFDFTKDESIVLDYENLPYASSHEMLKKSWRKRFKLNTLDRYTTKIEEEQSKFENDSTYVKKSKAVLEEEARSVTRDNIEDFFDIYDDLERKDWFEVYVNAIVTQYDPHTFYFAPEDKERFDMGMSGKFEGIGARLIKRDQEVRITEVLSGGPVWRDKLLEVGDVILKVAQEGEEPVEISGMRLEDSIKLIKGPKGTKVFLTIKRIDGTINQVVVVRDVIELEETYAKSSLIKNGSKNFGLIELPKFYADLKDYEGSPNAAYDVRSEIEQLKTKNIEGLILDLRGNGGGSLKTVVDMAGFFIDEGPIVQVKSTGGSKIVHYDENPGLVWDGPLVILVNEFSASASEILAAALQDYKRAIILGSKKTFGKGTVQNVIDLNKIVSRNTHGDLGALKITTDKFYRINGSSTQLEGVNSDVIFPNRYALIDIGEVEQKNPMSWDQISATKFKTPETDFNYEYAVAKSRSRLEKNTYIELIKKQAAWVKEQQNDFEFSLNYEQYNEKRISEKEYVKQFEKLKEFTSPFSFQWLPEVNHFKDIEQDEDLMEKRTRWVERLQKDMYISEAVQILEDMNKKIERRPLAQVQD